MSASEDNDGTCVDCNDVPGWNNWDGPYEGITLCSDCISDRHRGVGDFDCYETNDHQVGPDYWQGADGEWHCG
tara:strand:+ start:109 stop:327 length:219 start_codon:yes stop_codon:yes gene_type:complete